MTGRIETALPPALRHFWVMMAAGTALSVLYTAATAYMYKLRAPWGLPLLWGKGVGTDLMIFYPGFSKFGTPQFWSSFDYPFTYPAALGVFFARLFKLPHPVRVYMLLCGAGLASGAVLLAHGLHKAGLARGVAWAFTLTTLTMAWPVWLLFDTANIEGLVAIVLAGGVLALLCERWWLGAALVGVAGAMKIFPLALLGLLLTRRRYREFAGALGIAAGVTIISLHVLGPTIAEAQRNIDIGLTMVKNVYFFAQGRNTIAFDHSLWVPVRLVALWLDRIAVSMPAAQQSARATAVMEVSLRVYLLAAAAAGAALFFACIRKLPTLNQLLALTVCAVLLPPLSIDYTLLHLLLPCGLLCVYAACRRDAATPGLRACFICFAIIFNVDSFLTNRYIYAAEARTLALVALLIVVLRSPFAFAALDHAQPAMQPAAVEIATI